MTVSNLDLRHFFRSGFADFAEKEAVEDNTLCWSTV